MLRNIKSKIMGVKELLMGWGIKNKTKNITAYKIAAIEKYFFTHRFLL